MGAAMNQTQELRASYERFKARRPPHGFGLISEETQMLLDLLDGDISGLVQQQLAGSDVGPAHLEWQARALEVRHKVALCEAKLTEVTEHLELLESLSAGLVACAPPGNGSGS